MSEFASNTPPEHKDRWQTPIEIFNALDLEFAFYLDAAASRQNTLCQSWIDESQDALNRDWDTCGAIWCNPPYSNITPWVQKAAEQCREQNQTVVMLLPADTSTGWFSLALQTVDEVRLVIDGRIQFINAGTGKVGKNGPGKGNIFLIWRPFIKPRCQFTTVSRYELITIGSSIMAGVKAA